VRPRQLGIQAVNANMSPGAATTSCARTAEDHSTGGTGGVMGRLPRDQITDRRWRLGNRTACAKPCSTGSFQKCRLSSTMSFIRLIFPVLSNDDNSPSDGTSTFRERRFHAVLGENGAYPLELQRVKARSNARHRAPKLPRIAQGRYAQIMLTRFPMMHTDSWPYRMCN
jgi:hypothetical protein